MSVEHKREQAEKSSEQKAHVINRKWTANWHPLTPYTSNYSKYQRIKCKEAYQKNGHKNVETCTQAKYSI